MENSILESFPRVLTRESHSFLFRLFIDVHDILSERSSVFPYQQN